METTEGGSVAGGTKLPHFARTAPLDSVAGIGILLKLGFGKMIPLQKGIWKSLNEMLPKA